MRFDWFRVALLLSCFVAGLIPGFLSSGMGLQAAKASSKDGWYDFLSRFLVDTAISSLRILPSVLKFLEHRILL